MKRLLLIATLLAAPTLARAEGVSQVRTDVRDNILSAVDLTTTRSIIVDLVMPGTPAKVSQWSKARLSLFYTFGAATTVTVTFYCAIDGTHYAQITQRALTGTTSTVGAAVDTFSDGANFSKMLEYDVRGCRKAKWDVVGTGSPTSSDVVTADLALVSGL